MVATATTDASGNCSTSLPPVTGVQVVTRPGWQDQAGWNGDSANRPPATPAPSLAAGQSPEDEMPKPAYRKASVTATKVWLDSGSDGIQDNGRYGVASMQSKLLNIRRLPVIATTTTDSAGATEFRLSLDPGRVQPAVRQEQHLLLHRFVRLVGQCQDQTMISLAANGLRDVGSNA